jgi:Bacterial extracellular solute-binding protein
LPYPIYAIGTGSTMSINRDSANPDAAAAFLDYLYSDAFYDRISKDWPGDWNLPLTSIDEAKLSKSVSPIFAATSTSFSKAVAQGNYGYTTWTFWPPATEDYLIHGMEPVWLGKISTADYLAKMQEIFAKEMAEGKVPPPRGALRPDRGDRPSPSWCTNRLDQLSRWFAAALSGARARHQCSDHFNPGASHHRNGLLRMGRRIDAGFCRSG